MKTKILFIMAFVPMFSIAQNIGINTPTPAEQVHVAGSTSTIRIDGLDATNNVKNLGAGSSSRVYVNAAGDLVLGDASNNVAVLFDNANYLDDTHTTGGGCANVVNQTGGGTGFTQVACPRVIGAGTSSFTLTKNAIVEINYSLSWEVEKSGIPINDFHARIVQCYMYLRKGPTASGPTNPIVSTDLDGAAITLGGALGLNGQFYTNGSASGQGADFHNTGTDYVKLGPGTYTPMFAAGLTVGNAAGTGAVKMFVGESNDEVQIIAHYYQ